MPAAAESKTALTNFFFTSLVSSALCVVHLCKAAHLPFQPPFQ